MFISFYVLGQAKSKLDMRRWPSFDLLKELTQEKAHERFRLLH